MAETFVLTPEELIQVTNCKRSDAQSRALNFMGIHHKTRRNGTIVVLRTYVEDVLAGKRGERKAKPIDDGIDWEAARS